MIKAVLDTNVLASGIVGYSKPDNVPSEILHLWYKNRFYLVTSELLIQEMLHTFRKPYFEKHINPQRISRLAALLRYQSILTTITETVEGIATHPEDDIVLATALSGRAQYVVTGDEKLQKLSMLNKVIILNPKQFLKLVITTER